MSNLTTEQLQDLTERINARLVEFGRDVFKETSPGVVRLTYDVIAEWREDNDDDRMSAYQEGYREGHIAAETKSHDQAFTLGYKAGLEAAKRAPVADKPTEPQPAVSAQAVATLGPEHTVVTPLKNGNGEHKLTREERIKQELGEDVSARDRKLPTKAELIAEIKRISMAGMMPTMAAFDAARPAVWATAQAHCLRLKTNWTELAAEAELTIRTGPSGTETNP